LCNTCIINEYIKSTSNQFIELYGKIFNLIFKSGITSEMWVLGTMKPFYKNNTFNPKYYRPITIVSCFGKLFTAVLNARLVCLNFMMKCY
jgi:hypothetical protein